MRKIKFACFSLFFSTFAFSQTHVEVKVDTVKVVSGELTIQNDTKDVQGFLYNFGNGVTSFVRGAVKLNDSTYLIGADTLYIKRGTSLSLQQVTDAGNTTTNSVIIGSSNSAHSNQVGQLVQGANSTATGLHSAALNNSTSSGQDATSVNAATASGLNSFATGTSTASGIMSIAMGSANTSSGNNSIAMGANNSVIGHQSFAAGISNNIQNINTGAFGISNVSLVKHSFLAGRQNNCSQPGNDYNESDILLGISNSDGTIARGSVALGGANTVDNDFSVAAGYSNQTAAKGAVALGDHGKGQSYGEFVIGGSMPAGTGTAKPAGAAQTSFVNFVKHETGVETGGSSTHFLEIGYPENRGSDGRVGSGSPPPNFGFSYYQIEDLTVHYIQARLTAVTSTGDIMVWTIDTYIKNVGGTVTAGTSNFTNVVKDASFSGIDQVSLNFSAETGNNKKLLISYHTTGSFPVSQVQCVAMITKNKF